VYPLRLDETGTLANALAAHAPECMDIGETDTGMGGILHRLDTDTSGVVLVARTSEGWQRLRDQFERGLVVKTYLAVVEGLVHSAGRVASWLAHIPGRPGHLRVCEPPPPQGRQRAMWAVTEYVPVEQGPTRTLLRITIRTGVTHQIRCQLAHIGHPVVGDQRYGLPPAHAAAGLPARHWLHAVEIGFTDPDGGGWRTVGSLPPCGLHDVLYGGPGI